VIYPFNRGFRLKIISLLLDPVWLSTYGRSIIRPVYFEQDDEEAISSAILSYYEAYGKIPKDPDDIIAMCDMECSDVVYDIFGSDDNTELASDLVVQFAKEQAAKIAILESVEDVRIGAVSRIIERMEEVLSIGDNLHSPGLDVVADSDKWLYGIRSEKVTTGWHHVDMILDGGLDPGELGLVMAPVNRGKSMALINIGFGVAGLGSGKDVIHITHEMSDKKVSKRYAARMTFRFPKRNDDLPVYDDELHTAAKRLMPGRVRVLDLGRTTLLDVGQAIDRVLLDEDFQLGLIIDDYPDLLIPARRYKERRFELSAMYAELRAMGAKYEVPIWAATQSTRASMSKEPITLKDIAEDIGKANIADVVIAVCQTDEESDANQCRLFMAKVRDGVNRAMIQAKFFPKSQAIITTGFNS